MSNVKKIVLGALVLIFIGAGWYVFREVVRRSDKQAGQNVRSLTLALLAQNGSGERGTAVVSQHNGGTRVVVNLTGAPQSVAQPAHLHSGTCESLRGVQYSLLNLVNGVSTTDLDVSVDEVISSLPLAVNVHKSAEEIAIYVACGNVESF